MTLRTKFLLFSLWNIAGSEATAATPMLASMSGCESAAEVCSGSDVHN